MKQILCPYCLSPIDEGREACPFCGKSLQNRNPEGSLPFGSLLNEHYTVGRFLQMDGEGITYEAVNNENSQRVMLREYLPLTLTQGRSADGRLEPKEGREVLFKTNRMDFVDLYSTLRRITPATGLVNVLDVFELQDTAYAVTEVCGGQTLEHYLSQRKGPLKPEEARSLFQPVLEGAAALHKEGMVHRGISPENILILESGRAVLGGYATLALRTRGSELKDKLYEGYSAPEQYAPEQFEGRYTDVYALAAVFYRMITGTVPVTAPQRLVKDSLAPARELERDIPGYLSAVLSRALRLAPSERIQNVPELMGVLASPNAAHALIGEEEHRTEPRRKHSEHSRYALLMTVLVIICMMLMLLCWLIMSKNYQESHAPSEPPVSESVPELPEITVPNLVGRDYVGVQRDPAVMQEFRVTATYQHDATVGKGIILAQTPEPELVVTGEEIVISVVVSDGPEMVEMPYILGFPREQAEAAMAEAGLKYSLIPLDNSQGEYVSGCVAEVDVAAGTMINVNKIVTIYIAGDRNVDIIGG